MKTLKQKLSISLPVKSIKLVKSTYKKKGFDSFSDYINYLIDLYENSLSEEEILEDVREGREEYRKGKAITANSMAELL